MKILLAVGVLAFVAVSAQAKCQKDFAVAFGNKGGETVCEDCGVDPDCPWYEEESCCNRTKQEWEAAEKRDKDNPAANRCDDGPEGCQELTNLLDCMLCSPNTADFVSVNDDQTEIVYRYCKSFADRVCAACQDAEVDLNRWDTNKQGKDDGDCVKVSEEFKDCADVFENRPAPTGYKFEYAEDNKDCFSSASGLAASAVVVFGALATLF